MINFKLDTLTKWVVRIILILASLAAGIIAAFITVYIIRFIQYIIH